MYFSSGIEQRACIILRERIRTVILFFFFNFKVFVVEDIRAVQVVVHVTNWGCSDYLSWQSHHGLRSGGGACQALRMSNHRHVPIPRPIWPLNFSNSVLPETSRSWANWGKKRPIGQKISVAALILLLLHLVLWVPQVLQNLLLLSRCQRHAALIISQGREAFHDIEWAIIVSIDSVVIGLVRWKIVGGTLLPTLIVVGLIVWVGRSVHAGIGAV